MTKFEQVGTTYQLESETVAEAMRKFQYSCDVCCCRGMNIPCDRCAIATANKMVVAALVTRKMECA